jgi:hypothetical protein
MGQGAGSRVGTGRFQAMGQLQIQLARPPTTAAVAARSAVPGETSESPACVCATRERGERVCEARIRRAMDVCFYQYARIVDFHPTPLRVPPSPCLYRDKHPPTPSLTSWDGTSGKQHAVDSCELARQRGGVGFVEQNGHRPRPRSLQVLDVARRYVPAGRGRRARPVLGLAQDADERTGRRRRCSWW